MELTEGRIWRPALPDDEVPHMPRANVVIRSAGGGTLFAQSRLPFTDKRLHVVCYGSTRLEAEDVAKEAALAFREFKSGTWEKVAVRWIRVVGEPGSAVDDQTNWKFALVVVQLMHSTRYVS